MGLNTIVLIHNDYLHEIKTNPLRFTDELVGAIQGMKKDEDVLGSAAKVIETVHSGDSCLFLARGNTMRFWRNGPINDDEGRYKLIWRNDPTESVAFWRAWTLRVQKTGYWELELAHNNKPAVGTAPNRKLGKLQAVQALCHLTDHPFRYVNE